MNFWSSGERLHSFVNPPPLFLTSSLSFVLDLIKWCYVSLLQFIRKSKMQNETKWLQLHQCHQKSAMVPVVLNHIWFLMQYLNFHASVKLICNVTLNFIIVNFNFRHITKWFIPLYHFQILHFIYITFYTVYGNNTTVICHHTNRHNPCGSLVDRHKPPYAHEKYHRRSLSIRVIWSSKKGGHNKICTHQYDRTRQL